MSSFFTEAVIPIIEGFNQINILVGVEERFYFTCKGGPDICDFRIRPEVAPDDAVAVFNTTAEPNYLELIWMQSTTTVTPSSLQSKGLV